MDPFTLAALGSGVNALGKLLSGASSNAISKLQSQVYEVNAEVGKTNADILSKQADVAELGEGFAWAKGRVQQARIEDAGRQTLASQRSFFAGNNLSASFGSPLLIQALTAGKVQTDVDLTRAGAAIEAANAKSTAANIRGQAAGQQANSLSNLVSSIGARIKGNADLTAGFLGAGTALLSGASSFSKGGFSLPNFSIDLSNFGFNPVAGLTGA